MSIDASPTTPYERRRTLLQNAGWNPHDLVARRLAVRPSGRVLDVGCGHGAFLGGLGAGPVRVGIDTDPEAVAAARARFPDVEWRVAAAEHLPLDERRFDILTCLQALLHFHGPDATLQAMTRTLEPDGTAWFTCNGAEHLDELWQALARATASHPAFRFEPAPFSLADRMRHLLESAFAEVTLEEDRAHLVLDTRAALALLDTYRAAFDVGAREWQTALEAFERHLVPHGGIRVTASLTVARARRSRAS